MSARKMPSEPKVTMNGSIRPAVTSMPLAAPPTAPIARPATMPRAMTAQPVPSEGTALLMMMMIMPAVKAAIEPTERSRPPEVMTKVAPTAMMPMKEARATMLEMLLMVRKLPLSHVPRMASSSSATIGPRTPSRKRGRATRTGGCGSDTVVVMLPSLPQCPSGSGRSVPR